jgi:hypothetical protein
MSVSWSQERAQEMICEPQCIFMVAGGTADLCLICGCEKRGCSGRGAKHGVVRSPSFVLARDSSRRVFLDELLLLKQSSAKCMHRAKVRCNCATSKVNTKSHCHTRSGNLTQLKNMVAPVWATQQHLPNCCHQFFGRLCP